MPRVWQKSGLKIKAKQTVFKKGDHVRVNSKHYEFAGATGRIAVPPTAINKLIDNKKESYKGVKRSIKGKNKTFTHYWVKFDKPTDDGSGDGPYESAEIDGDFLELK